MPGPISDTYQGPLDDQGPWIECWQCSGVGLLAGCFEDTCSGADCDPEDAELCCSPSRCDVCKGKGGWDADEQEKPAAQALSSDQRQKPEN